jgi:SAM-dependent methyltransferase
VPRFHPDGQFELSPAEYNALYEGRPLPGIGVERAVWDIHEPRADIIAWHEQGLITSPVLDAGCGTGSNSIYLACCGHTVTGFDAAPAALDYASRAAEQAELNPATISFVLANATNLDLDSSYATVIDSALYHCLPPDQRSHYLARLTRVCVPGARLLMICSSDATPVGLPGPFRISRDELSRTLPAAGWTVTDLIAGFADTMWTPETVSRAAAIAGLTPVPTDKLTITSDGRLQYPTWVVMATAN